MDIYCTKKLANRIRSGVLPRSSQHAMTSSWYVNIFFAARREYIAAMESTSLVTVLFPAKGVLSLQSFFQVLRTTVLTHFSRKGWISVLGRQLAFDQKAEHVWAATDRRLLGSLNEMIRLSKWDMLDGYVSLDEVMDRTNETPMSMVDMESPQRMLQAMTEANREKDLPQSGRRW